MYIMKLLKIGILFILILITLTIKIIMDKNKISREAFNMTDKIKSQQDFLYKSIRYYRSLGDKKLDNVFDDLNKSEQNKFINLDGNNVLVESFAGDRTRTITKNKIDTCRALSSCEQLDDHPECGFCASTGKFDYNLGDNVAPDVCPTKIRKGDSEPTRMWARSSYDCKKITRQLMCDKVESCSDMAEGTEIGKWCGWCPGDSKAKVKTQGPKALLMYPDGEETQNTAIKGDVCPDMGAVDPNNPSAEPWFSELTKAGSCSVCESAGARNPDMTYTDACLNSLWQAPYVEGNVNVKCSTDMETLNKINNGKDVKEGDKIRNNRNVFYKIKSEINNNIHRVLGNFTKDYKEDPNKWNYISGTTRRKYNLKNIDDLWYKCFNKNRNTN